MEHYVPKKRKNLRLYNGQNHAWWWSLTQVSGSREPQELSLDLQQVQCCPLKALSEAVSLLVGNTRYTLYVCMYLMFNGRDSILAFCDTNLDFLPIFYCEKFQQRKAELYSKQPCVHHLDATVMNILRLLYHWSIPLAIHQCILCMMHFKVRCRHQYTCLLHFIVHRVQYLFKVLFLKVKFILNEMLKC